MTIHNAATRLDRLVSNLVEMTRLEAGGLKPQRGEQHSEVVEAALSHVDLEAHPAGRIDSQRSAPRVVRLCAA